MSEHPNPRIEKMAEAAYTIWHETLNAPPWNQASNMVRRKFFRMVEGMLDAAVADRKVA